MVIPSHRRGSVLIVVLFISMILSLLAVSLAYRSALVLRASRQRAIMVKLTAQMDSAAVIAMSRIAENTTGFDHPAQSWHTHAPLQNEGWLDDWTTVEGHAAPQYTIDYHVTDEQGKLHIHHASSESLHKLGLSDEQIVCLFDYMDGDEYSQVGGAESAYYQALPVPRRCKNAPLETLDELLAIKSFTPTDYWGDWNGRKDQPVGWVNILTCNGNGHININTAPRSILALYLSDEGVDQVDAYRQFDGFSSSQIEEHAFRSYQDIEQLQGLSDAERELLMDLAVFQSDHFRILITVMHITTGLRSNMDLLVRRVENRIDVLQRRRMIW